MTEELKKFAKQLTDEDGPERRKGYAELGEQLEAHADRLEMRLHRFFKKALIAIAIIGFFTAVALAGFGIVLRQQQETSDTLKATASQLKDLTLSNKKFASDIQEQRADSIRDACTAQNKRHDGSIAALTKGANHDIAHAKELGLKVTEVKRRRDVTIGLLNALAPFQDCEKLVKESVQGG
jgi:hypothetical protein